MQNEAKNQEGFEEIFGFGQKRNCRLSFHALFRKSETHLHSRHCYFWKSFEHNFLIYFSIFKMFGRDKPTKEVILRLEYLNPFYFLVIRDIFFINNVIPHIFPINIQFPIIQLNFISSQSNLSRHPSVNKRFLVGIVISLTRLFSVLSFLLILFTRHIFQTSAFGFFNIRLDKEICH